PATAPTGRPSSLRPLSQLDGTASFTARDAHPAYRSGRLDVPAGASAAAPVGGRGGHRVNTAIASTTAIAAASESQGASWELASAWIVMFPPARSVMVRDACPWPVTHAP